MPSYFYIQPQSVITKTGTKKIYNSDLKHFSDIKDAFKWGRIMLGHDDFLVAMRNTGEKKVTLVFIDEIHCRKNRKELEEINKQLF